MLLMKIKPFFLVKKDSPELLNWFFVVGGHGGGGGGFCTE